MPRSRCQMFAIFSLRDPVPSHPTPLMSSASSRPGHFLAWGNASERNSSKEDYVRQGREAIHKLAVTWFPICML
ncbi:hypothetical protein BgiMline_001271 [Biomphalaria glabrata]